MTIRGMGKSLLLAAVTGGLLLAYGAVAADDAKSEGDGKLSVAKVDGRKAFSGFARGDGLQKRFESLRAQANAAQQSGDNAKAGQIAQQLDRIQTDVRELMMDAVNSVAKEKHLDLVLGVRQMQQNGPSEVEAIYKEPGLKVPDITDAVVERINKLAATRPALDSQPASEPASQPTVNLNRPKLKLDAPKAK